MFTSSGYFRGVNCPFYVQGRGMCRRPYCHFRHVRSAREISDVCAKSAENISSNGSSYVATPLANCPKEGGASGATNSPSSSGVLQYKATPIQKPNSSEIGRQNSNTSEVSYKATRLYGHFGSIESDSDLAVPEPDLPAAKSISSEIQENNFSHSGIAQKSNKTLRRHSSLPNPEKCLDDGDSVHHSKRYSLDSLLSTNVSDGEYDPIVVEATFDNKKEETVKFTSNAKFVYHATKKDTQLTPKCESTTSSSDNELTYNPVKNYLTNTFIEKDGASSQVIEFPRSKKRAAVEDNVSHKKLKAGEGGQLCDVQFSSDEEGASNKSENGNIESIKDENEESNKEDNPVQIKPKISVEKLAEFYHRMKDAKTCTKKVKMTKTFSKMISEKDSRMQKSKVNNQTMKTDKSDGIGVLKEEKDSSELKQQPIKESSKTIKNTVSKSNKSLKIEKSDSSLDQTSKKDDSMTTTELKQSKKKSKEITSKSKMGNKSKSCDSGKGNVSNSKTKTVFKHEKKGKNGPHISEKCRQKPIKQGVVIDLTISSDESHKEKVDKHKIKLIKKVVEGKPVLSSKKDVYSLSSSSEETENRHGIKHTKTIVKSKPVLSSKKDVYSLSSSSEGTENRHGIKHTKTIVKSKPVLSSKKDVYSLSSSSEGTEKKLPKIIKRKISIELFGEDSDEEENVIPKRKKMETSKQEINECHTGKNVQEARNNKTASREGIRHPGKQPLKTCSKVSGKTTTNKELPHTLRTESNEGINNMNTGTDSDASTDYDVMNDDISHNDISSDIASDLTDFETDTYEECLKIFNEETEFKTEEVPDNKMGFADDLVEASSTGRKRQAHVSRHGEVMKRQIQRRIAPPSPAMVCHNRYLKLQKLLASRTEHTSDPKPSLDKRRQAHLPRIVPQSVQPTVKKVATTPHLGTSKKSTDVSKIVGKRVTNIATPSNNKHGSEWVTIAGTADRGSNRVAHIPKTKASKRPLVPVEYGKHIPNVVRQRYLTIFINELLKVGLEEQNSFDKALEEEKVACDKASSKNVYLNVCINTVKRIRSMKSGSPKGSLSPFPKKTVSHLANIGGKLAARTSFSFEEKIMADPSKLRGLDLYNKLKRYIMSEQELKDNGYPASDPNTPGKALIYTEQKKHVKSSDPNRNTCNRCGKAFLRRPDGHYITRDECIYHWGKLWKRRVSGSVECRYTCCSGDGEATGCCVGKLHVTDDKCGNFEGFMKTIAKSPLRNESPGVFAVDCEMCYTNKGLELTRVTVIGEEMQKVYDSLVKPSNPVIDHNSRFSGITADDMKSVTTTIRDVQAVLLSLFNAETILLGHSLESDLLALKLVHSTVIDTSLVFPHRRGPPFKRALRTLMAECLNTIIQNNVDGHDSTEDAKSCLQLMLWKIKEDTKIKTHS